MNKKFFLILSFCILLGACSSPKRNDIDPPNFYYKLFLDKDTGCQYEAVASEIYIKENLKTEKNYCGSLPTEAVLIKALPAIIHLDEKDNCYYVKSGWSKGRTPRLDTMGAPMCKEQDLDNPHEK